jgi:hypothetical protein
MPRTSSTTSFLRGWQEARTLWPEREPPGGNMHNWFGPLLLTICIANACSCGFLATYDE